MAGRYRFIFIICVFSLLLFSGCNIKAKSSQEIFCGENNTLTKDYYQRGVYYCNNNKFVCIDNRLSDNHCYYVLEEK